MKAVILAAGFGSRLSDQFPSKPLAPVCGKPLIEIAIRQAIRANISQFVVVTGHRAAELEQALEHISVDLHVEIECVRLDDWNVPNGHSVLAGAGDIRGEFLLMMADHILSDDIVAPLSSANIQDYGAVLAVDLRLDNPLIDPDDVTWVQCDNAGNIQAIGKQLEVFNAADCGAFLANHRLCDAISKAIADGKPGSLSDGMQVLAQRGEAKVMDIGDAWWIDVDDGHAHALAEAQIADHIAGFAPKKSLGANADKVGSA